MSKWTSAVTRGSRTYGALTRGLRVYALHLVELFSLVADADIFYRGQRVTEGQTFSV